MFRLNAAAKSISQQKNVILIFGENPGGTLEVRYLQERNGRFGKTIRIGAR